jgi:hypothetical protein
VRTIPAFYAVIAGAGCGMLRRAKSMRRSRGNVGCASANGASMAAVFPVPKEAAASAQRIPLAKEPATRERPAPWETMQLFASGWYDQTLVESSSG